MDNMDNMDNNMDFDFTADEAESNIEEQEQGSENSGGKKSKNRKGDKPKKKFNLMISNTMIRNMLIYAGLCLVVTILLIVFIKPKTEPVSDTRINTSCDDVRVFDDALSMSIGEKEELQAKIEEYQDKLKIDIVIATVNLDDPSTIRDEGKKIYEKGNFGWNTTRGDGLILIYETQTDKIELVTYGRLVDLINDNGLKKLSKAIRNESNTTYFLKSMSFLGVLSSSIKSSGSSPILLFALQTLLLSLPMGAITTVVMVFLYKRNRSKNLNKAYLNGGANSRIQYDEKSDTFVNSVTTSRTIQKSSSGSRSGGSGGGSRTGGGSL